MTFDYLSPLREPYRRVAYDDLPQRHPVRVFADYWHSRSTPDSVLHRSSFSPTDLPRIIPWMMILERRDEGRYRYRLCGTGCANLFGVDYTGCELGDYLPPRSTEIRRREFGEVGESGAPLFSHTQVPLKGREFNLILRGVFPVETIEGARDQVFVVAAPEGLKR